MPKYVRGNGKFRRKKLFQDNHMCDALCRISKSDPAWKEHFVSKAQRWLDGVEVPPAKLKRSALRAIVRREPYQLSGDYWRDNVNAIQMKLKVGGYPKLFIR